MGNRFSSLRRKEVVNVCDGARIGCVSDVEVDLCTGQVVALVVPCPCRGLGLLSRPEEFVIPWGCVKRIGDDILLVEGQLDKLRCPRGKRPGFL